jgi:hypothetical protein
MMAQPQILTMEEIAAAFELGRRTLGRRLSGPWPPPEDPSNLILALARAVLTLVRHIEAVENVPRKKKPAKEASLVLNR